MRRLIADCSTGLTSNHGGTGINLGDLWDVGGIFAYPQRISLRSTGDVPAFYSISGELQENGQIDIKVYLDQDMQPDHELTLRMQGAANCSSE